MTSPMRVFSFMTLFRNIPYYELINLTHVSCIGVKKNKLSLTMAHEKYSFFGNFVIFNGGGNVTKYSYFDTPEQAKQEFDSIQEQLDKYYKQK
jgi:hypothetical protein